MTIATRSAMAHHHRSALTSHRRSPSLSILTLLFFFLSFVAGKGFGQRCVESDDGTCQSIVDKEEDDEVRLCRSNVVLFEGLPDDPLTGVEGNRRRTYDDDYDAWDSAGGYAKVSRFSPEFEAWSRRMSSGGGDDDGAPPPPSSSSSKYLHVSPNGDHLGWIVRVPDAKSTPCLRVAKILVAREIVATTGRPSELRDSSEGVVDSMGPHRLVDEEGRPYPSRTSSNRLHLLMPRETFVHEAVEEGFVRTLTSSSAEGIGTTTLTTLSLAPRVFVVDPILSVDDCESLVTTAERSRFRRSGEVHYNPGYENYRTSLSSAVRNDDAVAIRLWNRVRDVTGLPGNAVEFPQPLKYEERDSWYKGHMDYFHNFENKPLEEIRMFVRTRTMELAKCNVSSELNDVLGGGGDASDIEERISRFDDIHSIMSRSLARKLAGDLGLMSEESADERVVIHDHLTNSAEPRRAFSRVAVLYAALLLERGTERAKALELAERYFSADGPPPEASSLEFDVQDYVPYVHKPVQLNNRHATVLPILRSAARGGHTSFHRSTSKMGLTLDSYDDETIRECREGLVVKPKAGQALLFYNRLPTGELDPLSRHAGCPPKEGEKYAANCFTWDTDMRWAQRFLGSAKDLYR